VGVEGRTTKVPGEKVQLALQQDRFSGGKERVGKGRGSLRKVGGFDEKGNRGPHRSEGGVWGRG